MYKYATSLNELDSKCHPKKQFAVLVMENITTLQHFDHYYYEVF